MWGTLYALLVLVLIVRVRSSDAPPPGPLTATRDEPLWLTRVHHRLFLALLVGAPIERLVLGGDGGGHLLGAVLFAGGVLLYRIAARALGSSLSPFVSPRPGAPLVTRGLYRWVRHPMYLSEAMIAVGAPLMLGSRVVVWLAVPALVVLVLRIVREEQALARVFPEYPHYAALTRRVVPFLF